MEVDRSITSHGVAILTLTGKLNADKAQHFRAELVQIVAEGHSRIAVDLSKVDFMDSSGLGALIGGLKAAREAGGDLRIIGPTEQVVLVLELTRLNEILISHSSPETAYQE